MEDPCGNFVGLGLVWAFLFFGRHFAEVHAVHDFLPEAGGAAASDEVGVEFFEVEAAFGFAFAVALGAVVVEEGPDGFEVEDPCCSVTSQEQEFSYQQECEYTNHGTVKAYIAEYRFAAFLLLVLGLSFPAPNCITMNKHRCAHLNYRNIPITRIVGKPG